MSLVDMSSSTRNIQFVDIVVCCYLSAKQSDLVLVRILFESDSIRIVTTVIMGLTFIFFAEEHEKERETAETDDNAIES